MRPPSRNPGRNLRHVLVLDKLMIPLCSVSVKSCHKQVIVPTSEFPPTSTHSESRLTKVWFRHCPLRIHSPREV